MAPIAKGALRVSSACRIRMGNVCLESARLCVRLLVSQLPGCILSSSAMSQDPQSKLLSSGLDFTPTLHHDTYDFINPERFDLNGEAVFITGASKGICRAVAMSFAKAGASYIALGARSDLSQTKKEVQEAAQHAGRKAPQILALKLDVANEASVQSAAREVEEAFGRLDILCNNAGALEPWASIAETRVDSWWNVWEVNIRGVYLVTRTLLPLMLRGGMETILNTTSVAAHFSMPGASR